MHVAAAIASIFVQRLRFRFERLGDHRGICAMNRFGRSNDCLGGSLAVIGRKRNIPLAIVERRHFCDVLLASFFLLAAYGLGRLA